MDSSDDVPVVFDRVWKKFRRGGSHDSLRTSIPAALRSVLSGGTVTDLDDPEFWALRDVSFSVRRGEALGIVGPNGSGKSTILKLLTRILGPTRGRCLVRGRTGALIEVSAGFHGDLTGRENIYLQGAILGMRRQRIDMRFDAIVEFAGLRHFIDTPVKRYSTGMNARLGFSIAAHLDPDVLLIDEVLGVGDIAFQEKCAGRIVEFRRNGVAIVFVSHNLAALNRVCDRALFLNGTPQAYGDTATVLDKYIAHMFAAAVPTDPGKMTIQGMRLTDLAGCSVSSVSPGCLLEFEATCRAVQTIGDYAVALRVYRSTDGLPVYDASWNGSELGFDVLEAGTELTVAFRFSVNLTRGHYHLAFHVYHIPSRLFLAHVRPAGLLDVQEDRTYEGVANLDVRPRAEVRRAGEYRRGQV
jgi:lipopolysaccharide transport system ATP-binding protein